MTGNVGPDHARKPAELLILQADLPSHHFDVLHSPEGPGHRLYRAIPRGTPPAGGWPVLYLLDGNAAFDFLTADMLAEAPGLVVIGVGYDTERQFARERRTLDFTPPESPGVGPSPDHVHEGRMAGGAEDFHARLTGPLRTLAETGLTIDPRRRTLWGHSFGGLFTLFALLGQPHGFARYAAISPSIWWDEARIRRIANDCTRMDNPPPLLVALGDREKRSGSDGPPPDGPAPATMQFITDLKAHPGIHTTPHVLPGLIHIQTIAGSLPLTLAFAS